MFFVFVFARSEYVHRPEITLEGELGLGGGLKQPLLQIV